MTQVTGILTDELGAVLANTTCAVVAVDQLVGQDGGARVKRGAIVVTDGSGEFDAAINPGVYELIVEVPTPSDPNVKARRIGRMTVHGDTMTLEEALDRNAEPVTPSLLQQAIEAKDAAEEAASQAQAIAGLEGGVITSPSDGTPGRVVTTGGAGWLLDGAVAEEVANMNTWQVSGAFRFGSSTVGRPPGSNAGSFIQVSRLSPDSGPARQFQLAFTVEGRMLHREMVNVGEYAPWKEIFTTDNILGTVSQSGGVPTGGIIQRGSNSNGEFVRFADGTQICTRVCDVDVTTLLFQEFSFAANFSSGTVLSAAVSYLTSLPNVALQVANIRAFGAAGAIFFVRLVTTGTSSAPSTPPEQLVMTAIGRWF